MSEEIFGYLDHNGYVQGTDKEKHLYGFFEVVGFVCFWIYRAGKKRLFEQKHTQWERLFCCLLSDWAAFFAQYPESPPLGGMTGEEITKMLIQKREAYDLLYTSRLESHGFLHARNRCGSHLLQQVLRHTSAEPQRFSEEINEPVVYYLGRIVQGILRQMDTLVAERTFGTE